MDLVGRGWMDISAQVFLPWVLLLTAEITRNLTLQRQSTFAQYHTTKAWSMKKVSVLMVSCFARSQSSGFIVPYFVICGGERPNRVKS